MTETTAVPAVTGFHHFAPTVSDVEASARWYERVFGMNRVPVIFPHYGAEEGGYAVEVSLPAVCARAASTVLPAVGAMNGLSERSSMMLRRKRRLTRH